MKPIWSKAGFTLIEVIIVVAILAILSVIALQVFGPQQGKARDAKRLANIDYMQNKLEYYFTEHEEYPLVDGSSLEGTADEGYEQMRDILADAYEERLRVIQDPGNLQYTYENRDASFCLCAELERGAEANSGPGCDFTGSTHYCVRGVQ